MRLILIGPPASGKGTQAKLLADRLGLVHIGTGDILSEAIRLETPVGRQAKPYYTAGKLVPDALVNEVVADRFRRDDRPERFVMDGYPRTLAQAASFDQVLRQQFLDLTAVILLRVDDEEIIRRLSDRRICPKCGALYHLITKPPRVPGICDNDGAPLVQRQDAGEETNRLRMRVYHENVRELISHYHAQGLLREVCGEGAIETVYTHLLQAIHQPGSPPC
jgi:adenylate kinase